jgi:hypothetical protein
MDMMNRVYGELIGGWIGKFVYVEVDEEGMAWGEDLHIRVEIRVDQPLVRGVPLKDSDEEKESRWFDLNYEKIPHFCFECGCLLHKDNVCSAEGREEDGGMQQWGEWLRASPRKPQRQPAPARPSMSSSNYSDWSGGSGSRYDGQPSVRDLPPRRNLLRDYSVSSSSRTGGFEHDGFKGGVEGEVNSPGKLAMGHRGGVEKGREEGEGSGSRQRG